jgi:hypothetical protein
MLQLLLSKKALRVIDYQDTFAAQNKNGRKRYKYA